MALLGVLSILCALTATGLSISCELCVSSDKNTCSGVRVVCPENQTCGKKIIDMTIDGTSTLIVNRLCSPQDQCNKSGSITVPQGTVQISISCCSTDGCDPDVTTLPTSQNNTTNVTNGVTCRSCLTVNSDSCYTSDTIQCTGYEDKCLLQTTKITGDQPVTVAMRGCATESVCNFGSQSFSSSSFTSAYDYMCTSGGLGTYSLISVPALVWILLLKLMF